MKAIATFFSSLNILFEVFGMTADMLKNFVAVGLETSIEYKEEAEAARAEAKAKRSTITTV